VGGGGNKHGIFLGIDKPERRVDEKREGPPYTLKKDTSREKRQHPPSNHEKVWAPIYRKTEKVIKLGPAQG